MKKLEIRTLSAKEFTAIMVLLSVIICLFLTVMLCAFPFREISVTDRLYLLGLLLIIISSMGILVWNAIALYRTRIILTERELIFFHGSKMIRTLSKESVTVNELMVLNAKNAFTYFCTATAEEIAAFAQKHWKKRKRIYRRKQLEELEKTIGGIWLIQVSIYLCFGGKQEKENIIRLNCFTSKAQLHAMWEIWQRKPLLLGSYGLYTPWHYL